MPLINLVPQPIREALASIGTIGTLLTDPTAREIVRTGKMPRGITPEQAARAEERTLSPFRALGFTPEETTTFMGQRPLAAGTKTGLGLASFFVPGGGATVGQALGRGLLSGALYGAGVAKPGEEIPGAITGGLAGGITGGALYGLGRGISGLKLKAQRAPGGELGSKLRDWGNINIGKAKGIKFNKKAADPFADFINKTVDAEEIARATGQPFSLRGLSNARNQVLDDVEALLKENITPIGTIDEIADSLMDIAPAVLNRTEDQTRKLLISDMRKALPAKLKRINDLTPQNVASIIAKIDDKAFANKFSPSIENATAELLYTELRGRLGQAVPTIKPLYEQLSQLYEILPDLAVRAERGARGIGLGATRIPFTGEAVELGRTIGGRTAQKIADILERTGGAGMPQSGTAGAGLGQLLGYAGPRVAAAATVPRRAEELQAAGVTPQEAAGILQEELGMTSDVLGALLGGVGQPTMGAGMQPTMGAALPGMLIQMEAQGMSPSEAAQILRQQGITEQDFMGITEQDIIGASEQMMGIGPFGLSPSQAADLQRLQFMQELGWSPKELRPMVADILFRQEGITPEIRAYAQAAGQELIETKEIPAEIRGQVLGYMQQLGITPPPVEKEKKFAEKEIALKEASSSAQVALDLLEKGVSTGPLATRMQQLGEKVGIVGAGTDYRSALALMNTALGNFFLGATIPEHEERRIVNLLPRPTDQEAVAKKKLEMIVKQLRKYE